MTNVTPPVEFAAWIACLAFAIMLFNQLSRAWFTVRGKPSPADSAAASAALSERIAKIETCTSACKREQDQRLDALEQQSVQEDRILVGSQQRRDDLLHFLHLRVRMRRVQVAEHARHSI